MTPRLDRCRVNGLETTYRFAGQGPPLILLHHAGGSSRRWSAVQPRLAEAWSVYAPDLPGHGASAEPEGDAWEAWHRFLPGFAAELELGDPPVVAHSLSGVAVAQNLVEGTYRPPTAVLVAPPASHDLPAPIRISRAGAAERAVTWKAFQDAVRRRMAADPSRIAEEDWQAVHDDFVQLKVQSTLRTLLPGYPEILQLPRTEKCLPNLHLVWSKLDKMVPKRVSSLWSERFPQARVHHLDEMGHLPMLENPVVFVGLLSAIL